LLSRSRGGLIALAAEMVVFFAMVVRSRASRRQLLVFAILLVLLAGFWFWSDSAHTLLRFLPASGTDDSVQMRLHILRDGVRMFAARPLLGWGIGTFPAVYPSFRSFYTDLFVNQAHNDYLQLLIECGALGFACAAWFLVVLFRRGLRLRAHGRRTSAIRTAAFLGAVGICVHSCFDFNLHVPANAAWFFVVCAIAANDHFQEAPLVGEIVADDTNDCS